MPSNGEIVRRVAIRYRHGSNRWNTTNDHQWGGKLCLYKGADRERRLDDKDNKFAIVHADQEPASYAQWHAHMFAAGMDAATRLIIARDTAAHSWSHCLYSFCGSAEDCRWLAAHKCAINPWDSAHYNGQRKLPPKGHRTASGAAGNQAVKGPADDAARQGLRIGVGGRPPKETPPATYAAGKKFEAASVQLKSGADRLVTQTQRKAAPRAYLEPHKRDRVPGVRGQDTCSVLRVDAADAGGIVDREHDHKDGAESVSPASDVANRGIIEFVRTHKNQGAERGEYMKLLGEGMRLLLGRDAGVSPRAHALVAEAQAAALSCSWEKRNALLKAPSALEAKVAAREAAQAAARGALDADDGADADDEAPPVPRGGPPPLPDSEGDAEWEEEVEDDGHAEDADALKATLATYLSKWGGDPRADDVRASLVAAFEA